MKRDYELENRLITWYAWASPGQLERGRSWYDEAGRIAGEMAALCGITQEQAAGILAAVSPTLSWGENIKIARRIAAYDHGWGTYRINIAKALRIRRGEQPADVLRGPKTRAFCANIAGDRTAVTVDRHMFTACGHNRRNCTPKQYATMAASIGHAAQRVGECPRDFQAVVWLVVRESRRARTHPGQARLFG